METKQIALVSILAATYALMSYLPISVYIGGEALITANIMILPLMAYLLKPIYGVMAGLIGAIAMYFTGTAIAPVYGLFTILIPILGVSFGSLTRKHCLAAIPWMTVGVVLYTFYSSGTPLWLVFYMFAVVVGLLTFRFKQLETLNCCVSTTISELIAMDIGSIFLLEFPGFLWIIILPFAIYERTLAVLGSTVLIKGLERYAGSYLDLDEKGKRNLVN